MTDSRPLDPEIEARLIAILRSDLQIGPEAEIGPDTPLIGGDFDLDSLDMVMLVTSVEKEFGIKLSDSQVGQEAFKTVRTLVEFLERQMAAPGGPAPEPQAGSAPASSPPIDLEDLLAGLPHGEPFRFVTRLVDLAPMQEGRAEWEMSGDEAFFAGHFPNRPMVPGVLIGEALAQLSGLVGASVPVPSQEPTDAELAYIEVRFRRAVTPPATLVLQSRLSATMEAMQQFEVRAEQGGEVVAEGRLALKRVR